MVTIKDVAREARVSVGTASEALAGRPRVRESTRQRVLAAAKRLRYQPSAVARGLVTHRTQTIGLLISDIANSFFVHAVRVIEDLAHENGYNVILCNTDEDPAKEAEYLRVLMERRVDGNILATTAAKEAIQEVGWRHIPLVLFDRRLPGMAISSVTVDGVTGGRLATQYLLKLGHRRIAIIHGPLVRSHGVGRLQGYQEVLQEAGVQPDPALIREGTFKQASGYALAQQLLTLTPPPTALFCTNNLLTRGALRALQEWRISIPHQLSLLGYDDMDWWMVTQPQLTVIAQPVQEVGREAVRLLFAQIDAGEAHVAVQGPFRIPLTQKTRPDYPAKHRSSMTRGNGSFIVAFPDVFFLVPRNETFRIHVGDAANRRIREGYGAPVSDTGSGPGLRSRIGSWQHLNAGGGFFEGK